MVVKESEVKGMKINPRVATSAKTLHLATTLFFTGLFKDSRFYKGSTSKYSYSHGIISLTTIIDAKAKVSYVNLDRFY
ncbi:MAG: hypothetical protein RMJ31_00625 [Nitrososphaerota archaeon]|nr:hypothetical protein [Nitrososphaerota archaeon]